MCCCNWLPSMLLKIFASMFIMDIGLKFSFLVESLPGFGIRMMLISENDLGRILSFWIIWNSFKWNDNSSSFCVWQNSPVNPSGPGLFLCGRLLIAVSTSDLVIGLLIVSTSSQFRQGGHRSPGIYPFLPGLLVYAHRVVCNIL